VTDEAVYVLTDTLLSDPDDLSPVAFTTKIHALPHLQALICGTGHAQAITEWVEQEIQDGHGRRPAGRCSMARFDTFLNVLGKAVLSLASMARLVSSRTNG
jgi:hypothetical protein